MSTITLARLAPLAVALPLLLAAALLALRTRLPRWPGTTLSLLLGCAIVAFFLAALDGPAWDRAVTWLGGWTPVRGQALGIALVVDAAAAQMVVLVGVVWIAAFAFGYDAIDDKEGLLAPMALVFLGAMCGLALSGDLFTLFVFYELMGVVAYALTAYKAERSALSGALLFAISNSVGAFLILIGLTLLYARTGALNLAQLGTDLAAAPADTLVLVSFALIISGFLVKSAIVPFHFWLPETHAVAPSPVSVLFSGVMVELGLYAAARVYWTVFDAVLSPHINGIRTLLLATACLTVVLGAVGAVFQRHLKRLLAFSTVSHAGLAWVGFALFTVKGSSGALIYMPGHGLVKGALFIVAGILLQLYSSADEPTLRGRARGHWGLLAIFVIAGLALAALPPFATFRGESAIDTSAARLGLHWVPWVLLVGEALTGGAVLRAAGRIFLGVGGSLGPEAGAPTEVSEESNDGVRGRATAVMTVPACLLLAFALAFGLTPRLEHQALRAAVQFEDQRGYVATVLHGSAPTLAAYDVAAERAQSNERERAQEIRFALAAVLAAIGVAAFQLRGRRARLAVGARGWLARGFGALHSGLPGDVVTWIVVGAAVFAAVLASLS